MERSGSLPRLLAYPRDGKDGWAEDAIVERLFCIERVYGSGVVALVRALKFGELGSRAGTRRAKGLRPLSMAGSFPRFPRMLSERCRPICSQYSKEAFSEWSILCLSKQYTFQIAAVCKDIASCHGGELPLCLIIASFSSEQTDSIQFHPLNSSF